MKPEIQSRISVLQEERSKRCQVTQDEVIHELKRLGFSDMRKFAKWNGDDVTLKDSDELTDDDAACVESLGQTTSLNGGSLSFKLHSKPKALELLARHLGMLNDKMSLGGQKDNPLVSIINPNNLSDIEKETVWMAIQKSKEEKCQPSQPTE
jgi:phage terminase small subunit